MSISDPDEFDVIVVTLPETSVMKDELFHGLCDLMEGTGCRYLSADDVVIIQDRQMIEVVFTVEHGDPDRNRLINLLSAGMVMHGADLLSIRKCRYHDAGIDVLWRWPNGHRMQ